MTQVPTMKEDAVPELCSVCGIPIAWECDRTSDGIQISARIPVPIWQNHNVWCPWRYHYYGYEDTLALHLNAYQAANLCAYLSWAWGGNWPCPNNGDWVGEMAQQLQAKMKSLGTKFTEYSPNGDCGTLANDYKGKTWTLSQQRPTPDECNHPYIRNFGWSTENKGWCEQCGQAFEFKKVEPK